MMAPCQFNICPFQHRATKAKEVANMMAPSRRTALTSQTMGKMIAGKPSTSRILAMFEPTTLPTAISGAPLNTASKLTTNSGEEVPQATTVRPITRGGTDSRCARVTAPRTNTSPPIRSSTKPPATIRYVMPRLHRWLPYQDSHTIHASRREKIAATKPHTHSI